VTVILPACAEIAPANRVPLVLDRYLTFVQKRLC